MVIHYDGAPGNLAYSEGILSVQKARQSADWPGTQMEAKEKVSTIAWDEGCI